MSIPKLFDAIGLFTDEELVETETAKFIVVSFDFATILFSFFLFWHHFRHRSGAAGQAEIQSAAEGTEMADVTEIKKIVPLTVCEIPFCQKVCMLVLGVDILGIQINPVKQPIKRNSLGSGYVSQLLDFCP